MNLIITVLILLDRDLDLSVCFRHPWTYQALAHDILTLTLNRTRVTPAPDSNTPTTATPPAPVTYDLDTSDEFWAVNANKPFPTVAGMSETVYFLSF